jgi:hypothetical protein
MKEDLGTDFNVERIVVLISRGSVAAIVALCGRPIKISERAAVAPDRDKFQTAITVDLPTQKAVTSGNLQSLRHSPRSSRFLEFRASQSGLCKRMCKSAL